MSMRNRTVAGITGTAVATALAGAAAFAAVPNMTAAVTMSGIPAHMEGLDDDAIAEMQTMMANGTSVGERHPWMDDPDIELGQMHGGMARSGMNHGRMHRSMATGAR